MRARGTRRRAFGNRVRLPRRCDAATGRVGQGEPDLFFSNGDDVLALKSPTSFAGTLSGFATGDAIDALNFALASTTFSFSEDSSNSFGTLTLTSGSSVAHILMDGVYSNASFQLVADSGAGALVKFV